MADFRPFRCLRYSDANVRIEDALAPPRALITPAIRQALYARSPFNAVRLVDGDEENPQKAAAARLDVWLHNRVIYREAAEAFHVVSQSLRRPDGTLGWHYGIVGACAIEEYSTAGVYPHQRSLVEQQADAFKMLQATRAHWAPVTAVYEDPDGTIDDLLVDAMDRNPVLDTLLDGVILRMWRVDEPPAVHKLRAALSRRPLMIAAGHHQYEAAAAYRDMMRLLHPTSDGNEPWNFVPMYLTDAESLCFSPIHRMIHDASVLSFAELQGSVGSLFRFVPAAANSEIESLMQWTPGAIGVVAREWCGVMVPQAAASIEAALGEGVPRATRALDVVVLHSCVIEKVLRTHSGLTKVVGFDHSLPDVIKRAANGEASVAFLLQPPDRAAVNAAARSGYALPPKSTFVHPTLPSGLLMYKF